MAKNYEEQIRTLVEAFGSESFVKIYQALKIGKMKFSFVSLKDAKDYADYYMDAHYFATQLMPLLRGGDAGWDAKKDFWNAKKCPLMQMIWAEKKRAEEASKQYGDAVWKGPVSKKGDVMYTFTIEPSTNNNNLFVFHLAIGKKKNYIVPITQNDLVDLIVRWAYLYEDYDKCMRETYSMEGMKNPYFDDAKEHKRAASDKEEPAETPKEKNTASEPTYEDEGVKVSNAPKYSVSSDAKQETQPTEKPAEKSGKDEVKTFKLKSLSTLQNNNGKTYLKANDIDGEEYIVFFDKVVGTKAWEEFDNFFSVVSRVFCCNGIVKQSEKNGKQLFVTSISRN